MSQSIDIYSNSWGPSDDGATLSGPGPLTLAAMEDGVYNGRGGLGNIYTWAAGNGLQSDDDSNADGYTNSRFTIAVTAVDHNGEQSYYAEPGPTSWCLLLRMGLEWGLQPRILLDPPIHQWRHYE